MMSMMSEMPNQGLRGTWLTVGMVTEPGKQE